MLIEQEAEDSGLGGCKQCMYTNKFLVFSDDTSTDVSQKFTKVHKNCNMQSYLDFCRHLWIMYQLNVILDTT